MRFSTSRNAKNVREQNGWTKDIFNKALENKKITEEWKKSSVVSKKKETIKNSETIET